jgi:DNA replication protein DnaC
MRERLADCGVPADLLHASFENALPRNKIDQANLAKAREFTKVGRGFLLLLGAVGTGKTFLGVALMREHLRTGPCALLIKQATLLRQLRERYRDQELPDPIEDCISAGLLVLDDLGVSGGGKDEAPMLHEILDTRKGRKLPTVITSNLSLDQLSEVFGPRLHDRLTEATFSVLTFNGPSRRKGARLGYFDEAV